MSAGENISFVIFIFWISRNSRNTIITVLIRDVHIRLTFQVTFKFARALGYFMFQTYIPTCLIVMMSWISFWIKPEAVPARVTLGVTSLLTLSTQHANSQKALPPVSYIKAIDMFMNACTVFVFCSLIEYALINVIMGDASEIERKNKRDKKKPGGLTNLLSKARRELSKQKTNCVRQVRTR